ncbi:MAG: bifunctional 2',3'-cyclic-nucleotide 2'-phosphodiesterase/3'-nucleotidase [Idiomarina sp.]|nr:bifunctional 2',3'-cyclic-nucleotide 2'-phosphodiesterase/3'-nucleotidase [Idiomarina sp.]
MIKCRWILWLWVGVMLVACGRSAEKAPAEVQVRLMETTDLHAYMLGYDYFRQQPTSAHGLAHTAVLILEARAEQPNHLLFDNGDLIQGSAMGDWAARGGTDYLANNTHPIMRALNHLNYDAANLGNHEFNFGLDFMKATIAGAEFPYVSANVFYADSPEQAGKRTEGWHNPLVPPYVILERDFVDQYGEHHLIRVGVIGFLPPQIMRWDAMHLSERVYVRDIVAAAQHFVPKMRDEGADIVVAIPHSGLNAHPRYPKFAEQATLQLARVPGIDAILFGHQHRVFPGDPSYNDLPGVDSERGLVHGVPAVQPGYWGNHLGIIDLTLIRERSRWRVSQSHVEVREITEAYDPEIVQLLSAEQEATLTMLNEPLARVESSINSYFARLWPDTSTAVINAAQVWFGQQLQAQGELPEGLPILSAAAPFRNGSQGPNDYTDIAPGLVTLGNLADLYVYPNTVQVVEVTGAQLREWLEMSALAFRVIDPNLAEPQPLLTRYPSYNFDVMSGVTYAFDPTQAPRYRSGGELINPDSRRVRDLRYAGQRVTDEQRFLVVTNNYRAAGGGGFPALDGSATVYVGQDEVRQVIADYALAQASGESGIIPVERELSWRLQLPQGVVVLVHSSDQAAATEESRNIPGLSRGEIYERGFRTYFWTTSALN